MQPTAKAPASGSSKQFTQAIHTSNSHDCKSIALIGERAFLIKIAAREIDDDGRSLCGGVSMSECPVAR